MKIAVIGSINMDQTVMAERIPLKGETIKGSDLQYIPGGKGANQAVAMARLGAKVTMFGCVGNDENGRSLLANLEKNNVKTDNIRTIDGVPTGIAIITLGEDDNTIVVVSGANSCTDIAYIESIKDELFKNDMVVLQHEIPLDAVQYAVELCNEKDIPVVLNPAPAADVPKDIVEKVTYLTPNEHEASLIFGKDISEEELLKKYPEKLIITKGSKGVSTCLKSGEILNIPCIKSSIADTTGAGDTFNGAFAVRISCGDNMNDALIYANTAAGLSVEKMGAQGGMPTAEEVALKTGRV
ncbi:MAG: ribokinase [Butyrivibrio sp.]|nr:ribokinase [Butyrivibrio sp.]